MFMADDLIVYVYGGGLDWICVCRMTRLYMFMADDLIVYVYGRGFDWICLWRMTHN